VALEIPVQVLPTVTGRVVDETTGLGVPGVKVQSLLRDKERRGNWVVAEATTGSNGKYTIRARPGDTMIDLKSVPITHLWSSAGKPPARVVNGDQTWPDFKLAPAASIDGIVADESGQAVAGAEISTLTTDRRPRGARWNFQTGPDGAFRIEQLDPDDTLPLWARAKFATTPGPVVVVPKDVKGKVRLTIGQRFAFRIRGTVVDRDGERIAGAEVKLWWSRSYITKEKGHENSTLNQMLESTETNDQGWFVFRGLNSSGKYQLYIEAKGHNRTEVHDVAASPGETRDVGTVTLDRTTAQVVGRVVDAAGRPVENAVVFNRGDGLERTATVTDSAGRFRLDGLFTGKKYVFVRKEGYRFAGAKVSDNAGTTTITLRRPEERPAPWTPVSSTSVEEQRAFAKQVLIRIWEKYGESEAAGCIMGMAEIDRSLALKWSAQVNHSYDSWIRQREAEDLAETDARGSLNLLVNDRDRFTQGAVQGLAERFAETDRAKALLFVDDAVVRANSLDAADRMLALAAAGRTLTRLGRVEDGRKLIEGAAESAKQLGTSQQPGWQRARVAATLAPLDIEQALALVNPIDREANWRNGCLALVASAVAQTDTARAIAMADAMEGRSSEQEELKSEIAYKIGASRPDEAIRIIESMRRDGNQGMQSGAFAWLAVAVAPSDPKRAYALIDRALVMPVDEPELYEAWDGQGAGMGAAVSVALCARGIGYPDMQSVVMRVLAARAVNRRRLDRDVARQVSTIAYATVPLALLDPDAARNVLEQIGSHGGADPAKCAPQSWLTAWALVDLDQARKIVDRELAALKGDKDDGLWRSGIFKMVNILATPPERREDVMRTWQLIGGWHPTRVQ
jgi:hypothetical protein